MRRLILLLATLPALAACATAEPRGRQVYHCEYRAPAPPGTLIMTATMTPGEAPRYFRLAWIPPAETGPLRLSALNWSGRAPVAPPDGTLLLITWRVPPGLGAAPLRLELRAQDGTAFRRGQAQPRAVYVGLGVGWGRLRAAAAAGPIEAVIVDRDGRVQAREAIAPALLDAPAAALAVAGPRWDGVVGNVARQCPAGMDSVEIIVVRSS